MKKRKAFTLLEIIVAMGILGLIMFTGWSLLTNVMKQSASGIGNVATQTEAKHIVESMVTIVKNASELEILDGKPDTFDGESKYLYTEADSDGNNVVHYFDGTKDIIINVSNNDSNELKFSGNDGENILDYEIKSTQGKEEYVSKSSVILNNLEKGIDNNTTSDDKSGHCIRFKAEENIALIVEFNFLKANNSGKNFENDVIGYVADGYIELWVPKTNDNSGRLLYSPSVKFFGDKVVFVPDGPLSDPALAVGMNGVNIKPESKYELEVVQTDFTDPVYYYVVRNGIVKEYKVVVKSDKEEIKVKIGQEKAPPTWEEGKEEKTIVFDENFVAYINNSNIKGTYTWYVQGVEDPIKVTDVGTDNILTVKELADHNNKEKSKIRYQNGGIDDTKYDKNNPNDNEDAMLYIMVKFTPEGSNQPTYSSKPMFVYPVTRTDLGKEFSDFYFKIATDVWVQSRMLETTLDINTRKSGKDMAEEFIKLYEANVNFGRPETDPKITYNYMSVKLNSKKATDVNKTKITANGDDKYADVTVALNYGYDKAPDLVRTMYKIQEISTNSYKIVPTIFTYGDNTTSKESVVYPGFTNKQGDGAYARTAFSIDVEYFMNNVNNLSNGGKISTISQLDMYEFEATYKPAKLEYVNNKQLDVAEKLEIKKLSVGVFNDNDGNGFRYMTGSGAEPQLPTKGYLKTVSYSGIYTSGYMQNYDTMNNHVLIPTESPTAYQANYAQEYVLSNDLKNPESITIKVNAIRQASTFYSQGGGVNQLQGKSINSYVEIYKNGTSVTGALPITSNTGMTQTEINDNLFTSASLLNTMIGYLGNNGTYTQLSNGIPIPNRQIDSGSNPTGYGYGKPAYIGTDYGKSYSNMLIGENMQAGHTDVRITGNPIRTITTQAQEARAFGSNTMGNYISVGSANDSHETNGAKRSTVGVNANKTLAKDQYAHYISDLKLGSGYESEAIEIREAKIIGNLQVQTVKNGIKGNIVDATVIEMKFNKHIRGGYGPDLYKKDAVTPVYIDSDILTYLKGNIGNKIEETNLNAINGKRYTTIEAYTPAAAYYSAKFEHNINAKDITIIDPITNTPYKVFTATQSKDDAVGSPYVDRKGYEHYIYKTAEDTLVAVIVGKLDSTKTYNIEFKRGAVQAMVGGAVPIKNGEIKPVDNAAWSIIPDGLTIGEDGKINFGMDMSGSGSHIIHGVGADGESIWLKAATNYYRNQGYAQDKLRDGKTVNMQQGFVVTIKSMEMEEPKLVDIYAPKYEGGFTGIGIYNHNKNDTGYAVVISDYFYQWSANSDQPLYGKQWGYQSLGVHSIIGHTPVGLDGKPLGESANDVQVIGATAGKAYYTREAGKYYTYKATFKGNSIKLQVLNEKEDTLLFERIVNLTTMSNEKQYGQQANIEFDTMDVQTGSRQTYFKEISIKPLSE